MERMDRVGRKLLATGNGRCNIMNALADKNSYAGDPAFTAPALSLYKKEYAAFWNELGLTLMQEEEGRMYPACNQASAVLDVLRLALDLNVPVPEIYGEIRRGDDGKLMTTGATLSECARTLQASGARRVWCVTLARSFRT